ncbi:MAG: PIN domain-containing protein, partial [Acidobacteriota bacterium]
MIVLDTHVWIWWLSASSDLSASARKAIDRARLDKAILISSISVWEVALLAQRKRLQ